MGHCCGRRTQLLCFLYCCKAIPNNVEEREMFNTGKTKKHHVYSYLEIQAFKVARYIEFKERN